jgi:hypothetical protein
MNTSSSSESTYAHLYVQGAPVFASTGEPLGQVGVPPVQGGALVIEQSWLRSQLLYVPLQWVRGQDVNGVSLTLSKAQMQEDQWKTPPSEEDTPSL